MLKKLALTAALVVAAVAGLGASSSPVEAATCNHGISTSTKTWSRCTGMVMQQQQAVALCNGFSWTQGPFWYFAYGNYAANGGLSVAICGYGGNAVSSSYKLT